MSKFLSHDDEAPNRMLVRHRVDPDGAPARQVVGAYLHHCSVPPPMPSTKPTTPRARMIERNRTAWRTDDSPLRRSIVKSIKHAFDQVKKKRDPKALETLRARLLRDKRVDIGALDDPQRMLDVLRVATKPKSAPVNMTLRAPLLVAAELSDAGTPMPWQAVAALLAMRCREPWPKIYDRVRKEHERMRKETQRLRG